MPAVATARPIDEVIPLEPARGYDALEVVRAVVDEGSLLEIKRLFARELITGFARIDGRAPELSVLVVDGDGTRLMGAAHLAGLTAADTNRQLRGGGGVDGAIHRAAGADRLHAACRAIGVCAPGYAVVTDGFDLPARFIIHTVGPVWRGGMQQEARLLASAHRRCLELAIELQCRSIAFPAISTGVYGYPKDLAADCSLKTVRDFLLDLGKPFEARKNFEAAMKKADKKFGDAPKKEK